MENMIVIYEGNLKTRAKHLMSGTEIMTDAPPDNEGEGSLFSPTDLVATALGSCMLTIMGLYAKRNNIDIRGTRLNITKIMASNPRRIGEVVIEIYFPDHPYTDKEKLTLEGFSRNCPVAHTLHPDVKQTVRFFFPSSEKN